MNSWTAGYAVALGVGLLIGAEREALDAVLLAAVALIALPLLPDRTLDRWGALNPQLIGRLTVVVLLINAVGYVTLRVFGARIGLPLTGFLGGFVSSTATTASLGKQARAAPASALRAGAVAILYASMFLWRASTAPNIKITDIGRAFDLRHAVTVAGTMTLVIGIGGWLGSAAGQRPPDTAGCRHRGDGNLRG